jgi:hypothetical protein
MTHDAPEPEVPKQTPPADGSAGKPGSSFAAEIARAGFVGGPADAVGMARLAATSLVRMLTAFTRGSIDTATELARDVGSGEPITEIIDHRVEMARSAAWRALGLEDRTAPTVVDRPGRRGAADRGLRAQGNELIRLSWKAENQPRDRHPSFAQILRAITPDEARIVRFLAVSGAQPAVDVRTKTPFGVGSERLAGGLSMIADMAGCAWPDRDQHYLANLNRLGLVRFSEEPVADFRRYSLIEAQPKVQEAMARAKKAKTVYRSIYLSRFGQEFAEICFDLEGYDAGGWNKFDPGDKIVGKGTPPVKKKKHH